MPVFGVLTLAVGAEEGDLTPSAAAHSFGLFGLGKDNCRAAVLQDAGQGVAFQLAVQRHNGGPHPQGAQADGGPGEPQGCGQPHHTFGSDPPVLQSSGQTPDRLGEIAVCMRARGVALQRHQKRPTAVFGKLIHQMLEGFECHHDASMRNGTPRGNGVLYLFR